VPGRMYYATVTGTDGAGNSVVAGTSLDLMVDASPPVQQGQGAVAVVNDGLEAELDIDCQSVAGAAVEATAVPGIVSVDATAAAWNATLGTALTTLATGTAPATIIQFHAAPFTDPESGVAVVEVCVGATPGGDDLLAWTAVPTQASAVQVALPRQMEGAVVFASVRATNAAGLQAAATSDGLRLLCQPGTVGCDYDGTFACLGV